VVNDALSGAENGWVGRATGILKIPCGMLLVAGGFDADGFYDFFVEKRYHGDDFIQERDIQEIDVPLNRP
jgi:hypothetical protein